MKNIVIFLIFIFSNISFSQLKIDNEKTFQEQLNTLSKKYKVNVVSYNIKKINGIEIIIITYCNKNKLNKKVIDKLP